MLTKRIPQVALVLMAIGSAACTDSNATGPRDFDSDLAFSTAPAGMDLVSSSYGPGEGNSMPWGGPMRGMGGPGMRNFMGGGLGDAFAGNAAPGRGPQRGPFGIRIDANCVFAASSGDLTCGPTARDGLTVTTIFTIKNAAGVAQSAIDSVTTNSVRTRTTVTGTATRSRDGSVTATVNNASDRSVVGLAATSTQRTVNGTSQGNESARGTNREGKAFTSVRTAADTTTAVIIPVSATSQTYPSSGSVVRRMKLVMTIEGVSTTTERREVLTYNGTASASLVITENGTTRNCTVALPRGRPVCQ